MTGASGSPWTAGRLAGAGEHRLLFGVTYEDVEVDAQALDGGGRVFAITGAGDTVVRLSRPGRSVVAVDVNGAQVRYVRRRVQSCGRKVGIADRLLDGVRTLAPLVGWTSRRVGRFLTMSDPAQQARFFDQVLDTARFRAAMRVGFAPITLLGAYRREFVGFLPPQFGRVLRGRLRRGVAMHPNATNPYARLLFAGQPPPSGRPTGPVDLAHAEAAAFLEAGPSGHYDGFALSNVLDGPGPAYAARLAAAVRRAARASAPVVLRTLREPVDAQARQRAQADRSMIWGGIIVCAAQDFPDAVRALV